jgi:cellulose biosynthesis protein BcsQ
MRRARTPAEYPPLHTIAVYSHKGGAGKSAVTVFLAEFLASQVFEGKRLLVIDMDAQQSSSVTLLREEPLMDALAQGKSLNKLLERRLKGNVTAEDTLLHMVERPAVTGRAKANYLGGLNVLAFDREGWHDLDDHLRDLGRRNGQAHISLLREVLEPVRKEFDVCLIDFPGHDDGPLVQCGLWAADRWLYPMTPDRMGARDLDSSRRVLREVFLKRNRKIKGLGTLLTMCQNRTSKEYQVARRILEKSAQRNCIPKLFSKEAELSFWTDAKNALDETWQAKTIVEKFGKSTTNPLYKAVRNLAKETLQRLGLPTPEGIDYEAEQINQLVTQNWK